MEVNTEEPFGETTDERLLSYLVEELEDYRVKIDPLYSKLIIEAYKLGRREK